MVAIVILSVHPSVCLSHAGIVTKLMKHRSQGLHHGIVPLSYFWGGGKGPSQNLDCERRHNEQEAQLPQRDSTSATHVFLGSLTDRALH